ncbi:unnamed protein product, partial [Brugia timori]|uniref:Inner membrane protein n=1 Tax=Brugia timori TaxID=42155 RepID=A0A0R3QS96_9BILA
MGNILVSIVQIHPYTLPGFLIVFVWAAAVIHAIYKFIIEKTGIGSILKPWGAVSIHQRMINENEVKRQRHINDIHLRVSTNDSDILEQRMHILSLNFFELRDELQNDSLTAVDVLNAFVWKAEMVQREINCVIDFLDESFEQAKNLDARWNNVSGKPPLF